MSDKKKIVEDASSDVHVGVRPVVTPIGAGLMIDTHTSETCPANKHRADIDRKGPSKVVSDAYRDGYDRIFGGPKAPYEA